LPSDFACGPGRGLGVADRGRAVGAGRSARGVHPPPQRADRLCQCRLEVRSLPGACLARRAQGDAGGGPEGPGDHPAHPRHPASAQGAGRAGRGAGDLVRRREGAGRPVPAGRFLRRRLQRPGHELHLDAHRVRALELQRLLPHAVQVAGPRAIAQRHGQGPHGLQLRGVGEPARVERPARLLPRHLRPQVLPVDQDHRRDVFRGGGQRTPPRPAVQRGDRGAAFPRVRLRDGGQQRGGHRWTTWARKTPLRSVGGSSSRLPGCGRG